MPAKAALAFTPPLHSGQGFELVARLSPDDWMRLAHGMQEDGLLPPPSAEPAGERG
jgi:hypothetical protein